MLVLTRQVGEFLMIGDDIEVRVVRVDGDHVRIGIVAPRHISIKRGELIEDIRSETKAAATPAEEAVKALSASMKPQSVDKS